MLRLILIFYNAMPLCEKEKSGEQRKENSMSNRREKNKPNLLFILADDMGAWALHCGGNYDIQTPHLDRLAQNGVRFENFFCASPVCSPARASILTGTMPSCHGVLDWLDGGNVRSDLPEIQGMEEFKYETKPIGYTDHLTAYTDILAEGGYKCGLSGKWHLGDSMNPHHGFSDWYTIARGGCGYYRPEIVENGKLRFENKYVTDLIADHALRTLEKYAQSDQPFYLSVHFTAPHSPWEEEDHPKEYLDLYRNCRFSATPDLPLHPNQVYTCPCGTGERRKELLTGYYASITAMDHQIGRIINKLEELGILEDTAIFFTSDNGMNLGHHGIWGKGNGTFPQNMFDSSVKVPFLASWKGHFPENKVCSELFSHYDILPTISELTELKCGTKQELPGKSFVEWLYVPDKPEERPIVIFDEYGPVRMLRDKEWKLTLRYPYGPNELYNLSNDPDEENNLYDESLYEDKIVEMRTQMDQWFKRYSDPNFDARCEGVTGTGQHCRPGAYAHLKEKYGEIPKFVLGNES